MVFSAKSKLTKLASHWDLLARDAKWAVLSADDRKGNRWDDDTFWQTGVADVEGVLNECARYGIRTGRALDFGCGVGRLSRALAPHFERVDGVDVSSAMIALARQSGRSNITFHENPYPNLRIFESGSFDFALSLMTLQHIPPRLMQSYLLELGRVLRSKGLVFVQIPDRPRARISSVRLRTFTRRLAFKVPGVKGVWKARRGTLPLEMYGMRSAQVEKVLANAGFDLLQMVVDQAAGDDWESRHYIARRR